MPGYGGTIMNELSLFNSLFDDAMGLGLPELCVSKNYGMPSVDINQTKENYELMMDLPGKTENDVDINLKENVLTISSRKEEAKEKKNDKDEREWLVRERRSYSFTRSFTLPQDVKVEEISATFKNGVLTIVMPRDNAVTEPKKIAITAA